MEKEYEIKNDLAILKTDLKKKKVTDLDQFKIIEYQKENYDYTNIVFKNLNKNKDKQRLKKSITIEIKKYFDKYHLTNENSVLVVGLGNASISSDSLGVKTVELVKAKNNFSNIIKNYPERKIYTYLPGILKDRGYMAFQGVRALINELKPDFLMIIDSFVSSDIHYLNNTFQITDRGIIPGSGIWNIEQDLSYQSLLIPVIVIGMASVVEASTIIKDALKIKENKVKFQEGYDFLVASKDVDIKIKEASEILADCINEVLKTNLFEE